LLYGQLHDPLQRSLQHAAGWRLWNVFLQYVQPGHMWPSYVWRQLHVWIDAMFRVDMLAVV
jgi:hypothetical protein